MNCVKDLARTLVSIIPSIASHLSAFSYVFTKIPEDQKQYMNGLAKTTYDSIKNEPDEGFKAILADIVRKTRKGVIAPNLLKDSPVNLLEELCDIKNFIQEPREVFQPFVSESSKGAVHMQVQKHKENIWLAYQNGDYILAKTKLDELTDLNNVLKLPTIENEYNDCVTKLTNEWNQRYEDAKSTLNKRIASQHSISKDDVLAYQKVVNELVAANELRTHLKDAICGDSLTQNINEQMKQLIHAIENEKEGNESTLQAYLDKMAQVQLKKKVVMYVDVARECIKKDKCMEFRKELEKIGKILILQEHLRSFIDIKEKIKDLESELLNEGRDALKKTIKEERVDNIKENKEKEKEERERVKVVNVRVKRLDKNEAYILKANVFLLEEAANAFELPCSKKLQKDYPTIFAYFPQDIIGQFDKRLKRIYVNLSDEMMRLTMEASSTLLKRKIAIAKAFSELDGFAQPIHKFHDLFSTYQNKIYNDEIEIKPALEAIKNRQYSTVATKMYELEQIDDPNKKKAFKDIKTSLSEDLYTLAKKIKVLPLEESEVDIKNLNELKDNLEYIKEAQVAIQFVNEMAKKEITRTIKKVKSDIKKNMEVEFNTFDRLLINLNFLEAKKKNYVDRVNQAKNAIEKKWKATYENEWKEIEDIIIKKVRAQLETACRDVETESLIQTQHFIRQCKTVMAVLPGHMKEMLNKDIKQSEAEIKDKMNKAMRNADEVLNTKNMDYINDFLDTCTNLEKNEIERQAPIIIRNMVERINQKWTNEDVTGVLKDLKDLLNIKSTKLNLSAANSFELTQNTFTEQFGKIRQKTTASLDVLDRYEVSPKTIESIEKLLDFFIQCMDFNADVKNKANEVMPSDFNEKVKELDRKISNSFSSLEKKYNINIVQKNAQDLQKVLSIMKIVGDDNFLQKLKTFKQKKMDCGIPEDFSTSTNLWTYSEIMNTLNSHLEKMLSDMIREGIINETTTKANDEAQIN
ncbi:hypothetical protein RFI_28639 [Reticulomyxa filosa]|uniref:Viral A-type inclusion protein n=1 Tax=Reticulomyxa filosa TaxID=46433 RepID=X6M432_RETFI|nr:hypothetical protein RFI_28639 [Reticulomyxa filosa]|eukprot:ETO08748.1 hypothetical protein RFI_28639 [Reticulomyxa filosa]